MLQKHKWVFLFLLQSFINLCTTCAQQNDQYVQFICEKRWFSCTCMWFTDIFFGKKHSMCPSLCISVFVWQINIHVKGLFVQTNRDVQIDRCQKITRNWEKLLEVLPDYPRREQKLPLRRISTVGIVLKFRQWPAQLLPRKSSPWCAVCPSYGVGSIDQVDLTQETSSTRVDWGRFHWVLYKMTF